MSECCIRVVDCGGNGARRADVIGGEVKNLVSTTEAGTPPQLLDFAVGKLLRGTKAIAFATAGVVEDHRVVVKSPNIPWLNGTDLAAMAKRETGLPAVVGNDMEAAVTGMAELFPKLPYFMGITWSSGIGLRIWREGIGILSDAEGGHVIIDNSPYAPLCGCGLRGCAESILGGDAVARRVKDELEVRGKSVPEDTHPSKYLDEQYEAGAPWACNIYDQVFDGMGVFLAGIQSLLCLPAIVWKGSFAKAFFRDPKKIAKLKERACRKIMKPSWVEDLTFHISPEPPVDKDSFIGASRLARDLLDLRSSGPRARSARRRPGTSGRNG